MDGSEDGETPEKPEITAKITIPVRKSLLGILIKVCYTDLEMPGPQCRAIRHWRSQKTFDFDIISNQREGWL